MRTPPPKGHRLLILATSSQRPVLQQLDITRVFDRQIRVPAVQDARELETVLLKSEIFDVGDVTEVVNRVVEYSNSQRVGVGIKTILTTAETSRLNSRPAEWFAEQMAEQIAINNPYEQAVGGN